MKLLYFYTDLEPKCKVQREVLDEFKDLDIQYIDCMKEKDLILDYQIRLVPSLVILDDKGKFMNKITGTINPDALKFILKVENDDLQS